MRTVDRMIISDPNEKTRNTTSIRLGALLTSLLMWTVLAYAKPADDLYLAAGAGNINEVDKLLKQGVNPDAAVDNSGITALMQAARIGDVEIVKLLLNKGANVNAQAGMGTTALMNAAAIGNLEMAKTLIDKGADVNTQDAQGLTALSHAKVAKKEEIVDLLKAHGAKRERKLPLSNQTIDEEKLK
jgi:ankyrin repeat protein